MVLEVHICAYLYASMDGGTDWFYFCVSPVSCFHNITIFLKHKRFLVEKRMLVRLPEDEIAHEWNIFS